MEKETELIGADTVAQKLGIKKPTAYKIISQANLKLAQSGKIVVRGKINRRYLDKLLDVSDV